MAEQQEDPRIYMAREIVNIATALESAYEHKRTIRTDLHIAEIRQLLDQLDRVEGRG